MIILSLIITTVKDTMRHSVVAIQIRQKIQAKRSSSVRKSSIFKTRALSLLHTMKRPNLTKEDNLALPLVHLARTHYNFVPPQLELDPQPKDLLVFLKRLSMTLQVNFQAITRDTMIAH